MSVREAIHVLDAIADALEAAHEKGVIHRDLKSDNVFIVPFRKERKVKLLDFGLAKLSGRGDSSINTTKDGIIVGTPAYMSPEQARGKSVDERTDIYALGCLAFKMVTGRLPFTAENAMDLIIKQLNDTPPNPAKYAQDLPAPLSKLIVKMMAKDPVERPSLPEIREVLASLRDARTAPPQTSKTSTKASRAIMVLVGVLLFLCGVISLGVVGILKDRGTTTPVAAAAPAKPSTAPVAGSAAAASPALGAVQAPAATIEFEDDKVAPTPRPSSPSSSPSPSPRPAGEGSSAAEAAPVELPKPAVGVILLMLDLSSQIELDGKVLSQDSKGGKFEVQPGAHTLRVKAPGREAVTRAIDVEAGATAVLRIGDESPAPAPAPAVAPPRTDDGVYDPSTDKVVPSDKQ
jgi:serine/threonine-protein kinase